MWKSLKVIGHSFVLSLPIIITVIVTIGFVLFVVAKNNGISNDSATPNRLLQELPQRSLVSVNTYVEKDLIPPTNRWFSSLAFQQPSNPVFAWPLAFKTTDTGFVLSQPQIKASPNTISAPFTADITARLGNQIEQTVSAYDDLSVNVVLRDQNVEQLEARLTRGSPFLHMTLHARKTLKLSSDNFVAGDIKDQRVMFESNGIRYGIVADNSISIKAMAGGKLIELSNGTQDAKLAIFAVPDGADSGPYFLAAKNPIAKTSVNSTASDGSVMTEYKLETSNGAHTLFGLLPAASKSVAKSSFGTFPTLEGTQIVQTGKTFKYETTLTKPDSQLKLQNLSAAERQQLMRLVTDDTAQLKFDKDDSYFAAKELYRAAQLLQLAKQLEMVDQSKMLQDKLKGQLNLWFDVDGYKSRSSKYFYYDNGIKGLVAAKSSFGSEEFNDHHFHYGYFLDAAAILGMYDAGFLNAKRDFIDLLAKDIMNIDRNDRDFPYQRNFDSYVGHGWASGFANFSDGQNQESSSEAVHAWAAAYQWATVTKNSDLQSAALALYNREAQAALNYSLAKPAYPEYIHNIVPLIWSGKLDYATFFNDTPEAKLGIQLIPMSPASIYLNPSKTALLPNALKGLNTELAGRQPTVFKDYLLMYEAMFDPAAAKLKLAMITPKDIDDGNSESYMYAWVYSR